MKLAFNIISLVIGIPTIIWLFHYNFQLTWAIVLFVTANNFMMMGRE